MCHAKKPRNLYPSAPCRHCTRRLSCHSTGLCWHCRTFAEIRALYPSTSKFARRGVGVGARGGEPEPTTALPGTPEKVAVIESRASLGLDLFRRGDAARE